jgi:5-methyltetrahydropteroyltriglutamate--homocysteine methyltransferase
MTIEIAAYQHGIYPRSEEVVQATRDIERGRTTHERVDRAFDADLEDFVGVQREAGVDFFSDGLLKWQDIFRPLVDASEAMRARTLVRWFDNNAFFRAPEISGDPSIDSKLPSVFESGSAIPEPRVATLPSPYMFSRAAHTADDRDKLMVQLAASVLGPVVEALVTREYRLIHLQEPWLTYFGMEPDSWEPFGEALAELRDAVSGIAKVVLHTYFGDASPYADRLRHLPVDAVGIDFVETDLDALGTDWEMAVLVGAIDGRRSVLESVEGTVTFARRVAETLQPPALYLSSNSDLELLPRDLAGRKVLRLGECARALGEVLGP